MQAKNSSIQKIIALMLLLDNFRNHEVVSTLAFYCVLVFLFVLNHLATMTSIKTVYLFASAFALLGHQYNRSPYLYSICVLGCILNLYGKTRFYKLPQVPEKVGYDRVRVPTKSKQIDAVIMYPTKQECKDEETSEDVTDSPKKIVNWLLPDTIFKMYQNPRNPAPVPFKIFEFFFTYMGSYQLQFSKAQRTASEDVIIFSHGKGGNMHSYSILLSQLASKRLVITPQHSELIKYHSSDPVEEKKFRVKEIQERAQEIVAAYEYANSPHFENYGKPVKRIYLAGHSYGSSTVLQAYRMIVAQRQSNHNIKGLIMLDPWMIPIQESVLSTPLPSQFPTLMVTNEIFIRDQEIRRHNYIFINAQKSSKLEHSSFVNIELKGADHLAQSDFGFVVGNMQGMIKNAECSAEYMTANVELVNEFISATQQEKPQLLGNRLNSHYEELRATLHI